MRISTLAMAKDHPLLGPYFSQRVNPQENTFVADGTKVVAKLLRSPLKVFSLVIQEEDKAGMDEVLSLAREKGIDPQRIFRIPRQILGQIVGYDYHQGVMALGEVPPATPLLELPRPIVAVEGITRAENVGSIVRNCAAYGIRSLLLGGGSVPPYHRRAVRVSMGGVFDLQWAQTSDLKTDLGKLSLAGCQPLLSGRADHSVDADTFNFPKEFVLVLGSEGDGLSPEILSQSYPLLSLSTEPRAPWLNVAASSAVFLHLWRLQEKHQ